MLVSIHLPISNPPPQAGNLILTTPTGRIRSDLPHNQLRHNLAPPPNPPIPTSKHELRRRTRRPNDKSKPTAREHRLLNTPRLRPGSSTRTRSRSYHTDPIRKEMDNPHTSTGLQTRTYLPPRRSVAVDTAALKQYNNPPSRIRADRSVHVYLSRWFWVR